MGSCPTIVSSHNALLTSIKQIPSEGTDTTEGLADGSCPMVGEPLGEEEGLVDIEGEKEGIELGLDEGIPEREGSEDGKSVGV